MCYLSGYLSDPLGGILDDLWRDPSNDLLGHPFLLILLTDYLNLTRRGLLIICVGV